MKRVFIALLLFPVSLVYSQSTILEPGVYKANAKGQNILLRVFEDNKYEMAIFHGKFVVENDTITFLNRERNSSPFDIKVNKEAPFSSTLKIKFKSESLMYASRNIYIGTQKEDNAVIEYKALSDFVNKRAFGYTARDFKIDVDKAKYLYFVDSNNGAKAIVSKFQIDENDNEIEVNYDGSSLQSIELKGMIDPETKKLSVMEGRTRRDILQFEKESTEAVKTNVLNPVAVTSEKDWKKNHGFKQELEFDSSFLEKRQKAKYNFKHVVIKSVQDGIKSIEKTPDKFLVVVVNDEKGSKTKFDEFIKEYELKQSRSMYKGYEATKDNFNFYLATEKDRASIEKFKLKEKPILLFLNSNGELVYHTDGKIEEKSDLFEPYYSVYNELKKANEHFKLDKLINSKKASMADFKKAFTEISNGKANSNTYYGNMQTDSVAVSVDEDIDYAVEAVDTAAAVVDGEDFYNYLRVEDSENLYAVKTPKEVIAAKWRSIVDFYTKNNTYDAEFIEICKKELLNSGFTTKLYGGQNLVNETDFKILDYLYKNYNQILDNEKKHSNPQANEYADVYGGDTYDYGYRRTNQIKDVLSTFFQKRTGESAHLHRSNQVKLIGYYKTFLPLSGYQFSGFSDYLQKIKETNINDTSLYFKEYKEYFNKVQSAKPSIIESLDEMYTIEKNRYPNWQEFKHNFALLANNVAWAVVETRNNDVNTIRDAIQWSETSLKIIKNEFHYLDTLAQLYYKNNQKEKGIETEKLAIENLNPNDTERIKSYGEVLESMKNGTY